MILPQTLIANLEIIEGINWLESIEHSNVKKN